MYGCFVIVSCVKLLDGFSVVCVVNFILVIFINFCMLLWVFLVIFEVFFLGEIFCNWFVI